MSTIAEFRLPAAETILAESFDRIPALTVTMEPSVVQGTPCLWIDGVDRDRFEEVLGSDPSVDSFTQLLETTERLLYDVTISDEAGLCELLVNQESTLLDVYGADGWWDIKARFQDRKALCRVHDQLVERGISVDLRRVSDIGAPAVEHSKLTERQREALQAARKHGYFEIPREISMQELAEKLGISHQALSERFRRAYGTLVKDELRVAAPSDS